MKHLVYGILAALGLSMLVACEEQNIPEALTIQTPPEKPDSYYENLRAYKKTDHPLAFGWFGNWSAAGSVMSTRLATAPDSMDIISIWGSYNQITPEMAEDMRYVQEVKGTKVIFTIFAHDIPKEYKLADGGVDRAGIEQYASDMCDSVYKYGYDGLDLDYEPGFGGTGPLVSGPGHMDNMEIFVRKLSERLGPNSGTGKLLCIDGVPYHLNEGLAQLFDYGIVQAYSSSGDADLQERFDNAYDNGWKPEQYIFTENFESLWSTGGTTYFRDKNGNVMPSLIGMARFNPTQGKKAGVGTYHMEYEYLALPDYKYLRQAIQIMNPAVYE